MNQTNDITLSKTTLGLLNSLISDALTADCNDTRHDCLCEAHRLLNPGDWRTLTAAESLAMEPNLIQKLRISKSCTEGEAVSTGQLHARRLLEQTPDYGLLMQMMAAIHGYDKSGVLDLDGILDSEFKADLQEYPEHVHQQVFAGFFKEVTDIYQAVMSQGEDHQLAEELTNL